VSPVAAALSCLTGADIDCDGEVNITELMNHINAWYLCSTCVPDIFQAMQAYYEIPFCGDHYCNASSGENCSSCEQDCGSCTLDPCAGIKECSNYTDSVNCTSNPCNISGACEWTGTDCQEAVLSFDGWRVIPIRSEEEYNLSMIGGEGEQNMHGLARSLSNPDVIYANQDVAGPWKSIDGGETWRKLIAKGLYVVKAYSIEVDPVNPDIVFIVSASHGDAGAKDEFEGLYRSIDGGDNWEHALPVVLDAYDASPAIRTAERRYQHNIAYDSSTVDASSRAKIWYAVFLGKGLYRSDNYGDKESWTQIVDLTAHEAIYEIEVNPSDGSVYIGTEQGLFKYTQSSGLQPLGDLPSGLVTSIEINPLNNDMVYATLQSSELAITGLYKSTDKGNTFNLLKQKKAVFPTLVRAFINPGYPDTIYLMGDRDWPRSPTIITHDGGQAWIENMNEITTYYLPGVPYTDYHKYLNAGDTGVVVPNPQDENEAVIFTNARFSKTTDGGYNWLRSNSLFTGYAVWTNSGFAFDKFDPYRFALSFCDVRVFTTRTGGDWFYSLSSDVGTWRSQWLLPSGAWGSYSCCLQPIQGSEKVVASVGDYPIGRERIRLMYLENESDGFSLIYNKLIGAQHLDENKIFVSDIYDDVKTKDGVFSETIPVGHYVRVIFDQNFTKHDAIVILTDKTSPNTIEAYTEDDYLITTFTNTWDKTYKASLANLAEEVDTLDFKMVDNDVEFDYIYEQAFYRFWFLSYHPTDPNIVYAGERISHDGGKTFELIKWLKVGGGDFKNYNPRIVGMCNAHPDTLYAIGGYVNQLLRSDDKGETWYLYAAPSWNFKAGADPIPTFTADPIDPDKVYTVYSDKDIAVFDGTTWTKLGVIDSVEKPVGLNLAVRQIAIDPRDNSIIYASLAASGVSTIWRSTDSGNTWQDISYNHPRMGCTMAVNPHTGSLFAGGMVGTWIFPPPYNSSNLVYNKAYPMPSCYDGLQNGDETGVDSGGSCA